jgi:hypothetical protein
MTDEHCTFEHALFDQPRPEHGYCTDDMARVLVVASREPKATAVARHLVDVSLRFLLEAQDARGRCRNRMNRDGVWEDRPGLDDCWGRSIWGLGTAAAHNKDPAIRRTATAHVERASWQRSPWPRAMAFAALGAAELLSVSPDNELVRLLLSDAADAITPSQEVPGWPWPEPRLTYANAVLPDAMMAAGTVLDRPGLVKQGLELLEWLLGHESCAGHLSVAPVGGCGPDDKGPAFDQQPIEVAALADACARAASLDPDGPWADGLSAAVRWFLGDNDAKAVMWDPATGGGFDGLEAGGPNLNQGAESTLAFLSTMQHARSLVGVPA